MLVRVLLIAFVAICFSTSNVNANSFTFEGSGTNVPGRPVSATAVVTTGVDMLTVTLTNTTTNTVAAADILTGFLFSLSSGSGGSVASQTGTSVVIDGNGFAPTSSNGSIPVAERWAHGDLGSGDFELTWNGPGPDYGIIGPGDAVVSPIAGIEWLNANGSIAGNGPHNPFILETTTIKINLDGVTMDTVVSDVTFLYGTEQETSIPGKPEEIVPVPSSLAMLGSLLFGCGILRCAPQLLKKRRLSTNE